MQEREHEGHLQAMSESPSVKANSLSQKLLKVAPTNVRWSMISVTDITTPVAQEMASTVTHGRRVPESKAEFPLVQDPCKQEKWQRKRKD